MESLVRFLLVPFVANPDEVRITSVENASSVLLELRVHPDDLSRVRGPEEAHLRAIQQVLSAAGGTRKPVLDLRETGSSSAEE